MLLIPGGVPPYPVARFTVAEYHKLIELGILTEDDNVELLEGWIVPKMARNTPHDVCLDKSQDVLRALLPPGWRLRVQSAITTLDSEPEPDFAIVPGPAERYLAHHPYAVDISVLIEVSDSTLSHDRNDKGRIYANAGIVCYWIVNLVDRQVEVYSDPTGPDADPRFRQQQDYRPGDAVPLVIDGKQIGAVPVSGLLP